MLYYTNSVHDPFRILTHNLANTGDLKYTIATFMLPGKHGDCVCMLLDSYWPLVFGIPLVSSRSLLSSYLLQLFCCFGFSPLSPHTSIRLVSPVGAHGFNVSV